MVSAHVANDGPARDGLPLPALFDEQQFDVVTGSALEQLANRSAVPVGLHTAVDRLAPSVEAALFFVSSEALANAAKHAAATRVTIDLVADARCVTLEIADDGVGGADVGRGSGLAGLADRVDALGGSFRLLSPPGGGTRIEVTVPRVSDFA